MDFFEFRHSQVQTLQGEIREKTQKFSVAGLMRLTPVRLHTASEQTEIERKP